MPEGGVTPVSSSGGIASGTSFPAAPTTNELFYRTDLALLFYYDGTRWLTVQENHEVLFRQNAVTTGNSGNWQGANPSRQSLDMWVTAFTGATLVATTNDASNYWTMNLKLIGTNGAVSDFGTPVQISTAADTHDVVTPHTVAVNQSVHAATYPILVFTGTKVGSAGALSNTVAVRYRLIGT